MGKGDKKSKKGKLKKGSYGNTRPHKPTKHKGLAEAQAKEAAK
ncbi:30S ribosomal protein THX [Pontibacter ruber]|uniref:30S ribosomal protein THX n=1 Tax=Pontibacter ruber TaxID=1343895 RepID=A0ABW5D1U9_9BACT|nr:30S ribosomal protein THX [Pontibacter ruber]